MFIRYYKTGEEPKPKTSESSAVDGTLTSSEGSRTLHLTVVEGKGLRELELMGSQDPMVKVSTLTVYREGKGSRPMHWQRIGPTAVMLKHRFLCVYDAMQVEVLGCESKAQTGAVKDGGKNPKWAQGTGSLDLHLPTTVDTSQATLRLHVS